MKSCSHRLRMNRPARQPILGVRLAWELSSRIRPVSTPRVRRWNNKKKSPEYGWFFSDYFMKFFNDLDLFLTHIGTFIFSRCTKILCRVSGNWLSLMLQQEPVNAGSCANRPEIWSQKYGSYGHGERPEDHRVVLDANLLTGMENGPTNWTVSISAKEVNTYLT